MGAVTACLLESMRQAVLPLFLAQAVGMVLGVVGPNATAVTLALSAHCLDRPDAGLADVSVLMVMPVSCRHHNGHCAQFLPELSM